MVWSFDIARKIIPLHMHVYIIHYNSMCIKHIEHGHGSSIVHRSSSPRRGGSAASAEGMADPVWHSSRGVSSVRREGVPRAWGRLDLVEIKGWRWMRDVFCSIYKYDKINYLI